MKKPLWLIKWTRYEYWPVWLFFMPAVLVFWPLLALRSRAFLYMTATNPGIPLGGFFGEKKYDIIKDIPARYLPKTFLLLQNEFSKVDEVISGNGFLFPLIAKPNIGERGSNVEKIRDINELQAYLQQAREDIILQEFISLHMEFGVLYYKFPDGSESGITSIVRKGFMEVTGDGKSTLRQLLEKSDRARFQLKTLEHDGHTRLDEVLPEGQKRLVQPIGNHCKGTAFIDANKLINKQLIGTFDKIAAHMPGFFFGRFDIKVAGEEALYKGDIKIMEVNGTTSEPGHIYDMETMNLRTAWRDIWRNMKIVRAIGVMNHRQYGVPYTPMGQFLGTVYHHFFKR